MDGLVAVVRSVWSLVSMEKHQEEEELTQLINSEAAAPALCSAPARGAAH